MERRMRSDIEREVSNERGATLQRFEDMERELQRLVENRHSPGRSGVDERSVEAVVATARDLTGAVWRLEGDVASRNACLEKKVVGLHHECASELPTRLSRIEAQLVLVEARLDPP